MAGITANSTAKLRKYLKRKHGDKRNKGLVYAEVLRRRIRSRK